MIYSLCLLLILVGLYGIVASRQTLKIVIAIVIMQHGVHLLLLLIGYREGGSPRRMVPAGARLVARDQHLPVLCSKPDDVRLLARRVAPWVGFSKPPRQCLRQHSKPTHGIARWKRRSRGRSVRDRARCPTPSSVVRFSLRSRFWSSA